VTFTYAASREAAEKLANETGSTAVLTDSANRDAVIATVRETGLLDVLVINAGIVVFGDPLEHDPDDVDRLFRINVHSPFHAAVEAARQMPNGGRIIVIGSAKGDRMPIAGMAAYALSKSAMHRKRSRQWWHGWRVRKRASYRPRCTRSTVRSSRDSTLIDMLSRSAMPGCHRRPDPGNPYP
jgi:NAD(P)-dependent dehydrogenase (short-subunit alcohol dehydrogenase family)